MTIYRLRGIPGSPFTRKVQVVLDEKGLQHEDVFTNIFPVPPAFAAINPMKRVPVLDVVDGDRVRHLGDSTAIGLYLERAHPEVPLYPTDAFELGRALMYEEFADTELAGAIGMGVFRPLVLSAMRGKAVDLDRVREVLEQRLPPLFTALEAELDGRPHFASVGFSIVDIAVATQIQNLRFAGQDVSITSWPHLRANVDATLARPSFARRIAAERKLLPPPMALPSTQG